jgi:hypothetical protein
LEGSLSRAGAWLYGRAHNRPRTWNDGFQRAARGVGQLRIELLPRITTPRYTPPRFGLYKEAHTTQCTPGGPVGVINRNAQVEHITSAFLGDSRPPPPPRNAALASSRLIGQPRRLGLAVSARTHAVGPCCGPWGAADSPPFARGKALAAGMRGFRPTDSHLTANRHRSRLPRLTKSFRQATGRRGVLCPAER